MSDGRERIGVTYPGPEVRRHALIFCTCPLITDFFERLDLVAELGSGVPEDFLVRRRQTLGSRIKIPEDNRDIPSQRRKALHQRLPYQVTVMIQLDTGGELCGI